MRSIILFISILAFSAAASAQLIDSEAKDKRAAAVEQLSALRSGSLLFRLSTKEPSISKLREKGREDAADRMQSEVDTENRAIMEGFRKHFTFSKVYFFYSHHSQSVRAQNWDEVIFLSEELKEDSTIHPDLSQPYLTADIGNVQKDVRNSAALRNNNGEMNGSSGRVGGTDFQSYGLIFRDSELVQLMKPFPYLIKQREFLFKRSYARMAQLAQERLEIAHERLSP